MTTLDGRRLLVMESASLIPEAAMSYALKRLGAEVIGPASTLADAMARLGAAKVDGAVLDVKLGLDLVYPMAEKLMQRRVPFVFV